MMYPLVRGLAAKDAPIRMPVTVTCRALGLARQPYYRWLEQPVTDAEIEEAYRAYSTEARLVAAQQIAVSPSLIGTTTPADGTLVRHARVEVVEPGPGCTR